ncbi:uncharacterized protein LOC144435870 [Glandiceps talaboti]
MASNVTSSNEDGSPRQPTPLPWKKVLVICLLQFTNSFSLTVVFPLLPFMTHDFFPYLNVSQLGLYTGFLGGAFSAGSFFGNIMWGRVADTYGRRPALLFGLVGTFFCVMFFGFSISFIWAVSFRFLWGLLNGIIAVTKTYLSEICDDSNMAKGFSLLGTAAGISRLLAPAVAGFMSCTAVKYEVLNTAILRDFPYLLPCVFSAVLCFVTWIGAIFYLKETLKKSAADNSSDSEIDSAEDDPDANQSTTHELPPTTSMSESSNVERLYVPQELPPTTSMSESSNVERLYVPQELHPATNMSAAVVTDIESVYVPSNTSIACPGNQYSVNEDDGNDECGVAKSQWINCCLCCPWRKQNYKYNRLEQKSDSSSCCERCKKGIDKTVTPLRDKTVLIAIALQVILAFCTSIHSQILPLLLVTDYTHGGYDFDTAEISFMYAVMAVPETLYQIIIYPMIIKLLGFKHAMQIGLIIFACFTALIPHVNKITGPIFVADIPLNTAMPLTEQTETLSSLQEVTTSILHRPLTTPGVKQMSTLTVTAPMLQHHLQSARQIGNIPNVISERLKWTKEVDKLSHNSVLDNRVPFYELLMRRPKDLQSIYDYTAPKNDYSINMTVHIPVKSPRHDKSSSSQPWTNITDNLVKQCKILSGTKKDEHVSLKQVPIKVWVILIIIVTGSTTGRMTAFVSSNVIVGNSCLSKNKATVYGVAQSVTAFFRSIGPAVGGNFFAWTEKTNLSWPFNYHLTFYILFVILNITAAVCTFLPKSINKKRVEGEEVDAVA